MKFSVFIATSLDGYIARPNGDIDWLEDERYVLEGEDYGYHSFINSVDCIIMGRKTFEKVISFPEWPYGSMKLFVLSRTLSEVPEHLQETVELFSGSLRDLLKQLAHFKHAYVDGGQLIQSFLKENLITDLIITRIPILLGDGIPLFGTHYKEVNLTHIKTDTFKTGLTQSIYQVDKDV